MASNPTRKKINLALQGGGSHGAYTWGVLDRLLESTDILSIEGVSGASAGAMNAAVMMQGWNDGGPEGAKKLLDHFWRRVSSMNPFGPSQTNSFTNFFSSMNMEAPTNVMADMMQRMFSPYQSNPLNFNPLRDLLDEIIDIPAIKSCQALKLFISATNVETGRIRVFHKEEMSIDVLMASACLPFAFQAVEIEGKPYWDGGYVGNPAIFPIIYECTSPDVVLVQINPLIREGTPNTPSEIINRMNEISFNASLISEMRAIAFVQRLIEDDHLKSEESARLKKMNVHMIYAGNQLNRFGANSKANVDWDFLLQLKEVGRAAASQWLKDTYDTLGTGSSVDIKKVFL